MNNYTENDAFEFGNKDDSFNYNLTNGLERNSYENENLFNTEVYNDEESNFLKTNTEALTNEMNKDDLNQSVTPVESGLESVFGSFLPNDFEVDTSETRDVVDSVNPFIAHESLDLVNESKKEMNELQNDISNFSNEILPQPTQDSIDLSDSSSTQKTEDNILSQIEQVEMSQEVEKNETEENILVKDIVETPVSEIEQQASNPIQMSNENLSHLTEFKEEKIETSDIKTLFDRVGINVKEASDIFKRNTEMKEKLDSRFEELKKLQLEVSKNKQDQFDEINSYKDEVLDKLNQKKEEIEKRLNKLKEFQASLEKEKEEFEQYRKKEKEEIERVQKEVQDAYDSRREELRHIEDVLRRQKDSLDEERSQLSLDKIQYESDKNELANNLLKFNEIVDSFTSGIDKIDKE